MIYENSEILGSVLNLKFESLSNYTHRANFIKGLSEFETRSLLVVFKKQGRSRTKTSIYRMERMIIEFRNNKLTQLGI